MVNSYARTGGRVLYVSPEADGDAGQFRIFLGSNGKLRILRISPCDSAPPCQAVVATLAQLTNLAAQTDKLGLRSQLESAAHAIVDSYREELTRSVKPSILFGTATAETIRDAGAFADLLG